MTEPQERVLGWLGVASEMDDEGRWTCHLLIDGEPLRQLSVEAARDMAVEVAWAVACAEYEAAMLSQLTSIVISDAEAALFLRSMRSGGRRVQDSLTDPLIFRPIISHRTREPMINVAVRVNATVVRKWQWRLDDARRFVTSLLEEVQAVQLDALYAAVLRERVGLDSQHARKMIALLRSHFPGDAPPPPPPG